MIQIEDSTESEITKLKENIAISTGEKKSYRMKIQAQIEQSRLTMRHHGNGCPWQQSH